jgi:hypothetical protein
MRREWFVKSKRCFLWFVVLLGAAGLSLYLFQTPSPPFCSEILSYFEKNLRKEGRLSHRDSLVYLTLDPSYLTVFSSLLKQKGFQLPPDPSSIGAHITVIYPREISSDKAHQIEEYGLFFPFTIKGCKIVSPSQWQGIDQAYVVQVTAPVLDELRRKYGLPLKKWEFHITLAVK